MADPFSITGSAVGVISLGLTVLSGLLQYYGDWKDSEQDIAATYTSIEGLTKTFMLIKDTLEGQSFRREIVDRVTESSDSCSAGVQSLEKKLAKIRGATPDKPGEKLRAHARKAAYPFKKSTLIKLAEVVSDLRDNLSLAVNTLQLDMSGSSLRKLEDISARLAVLGQQSQSVSSDIIRDVAEVRLTQKDHEARLLNQERLQIIEWLSPLNFSIRQNDVRSRRQQGAGNWLLQSDQFQMWLDGRINVLLCPGMPGAGKTVLASVIVDYLKQWTQQDSVAIGYVYCIYNAVDQTATNLIASLFQQVVQQQSVLSGDVTSLYDHHNEERTRPSLPEYIRLLQAHIQRFSRIFIVVDALDECSEDDGVRDLFLAQLRYLLPNIRLLVTSREITSLGRAFDDATRLEIRANEDDLRTYIQVQIEEQALLRSHIKDDPSLKDTIINTIIEKANGMFLLAELHLNSLVNQDSRRRLRRALQSLPKEIGKTYEETMSRIESQDRQKVERAGQVLSWISLAERPLTVQELQCALALEPEDTEFDEEAVPNVNALLSVCCGLVVVEQESNIIRFVHYTTEKYVEQIRQTRYPSAQMFLSQTCLTYLSLKVFASGPCTGKDVNTARENLKTRLRVNPLLGYAAQHWGNHARKALEQDLAIDELILKFLSAKGSVRSSVEVLHRPEQPHPWNPAESYTDVSNLHIVAGFGLDKLARKLIDQGMHVNARDYQGCTPLLRAAVTGHDATVRLLLEQGANRRAENRWRSTALSLAASAGYEKVVQTLLEVESEVYLRRTSVLNDFRGAARNGHVKVIQVLLKRLAYDERSRRWVCELLLDSAAIEGQVRVVSLLLEEFGGLRGFEELGGRALNNASYSNHTSVMELLLGAGADMDAVGLFQNTALHATVRFGYVAATQMLLDKGANLEAAGRNGDKPLHIATQKGHDKIISLLLDKGANLESIAENGDTALIRAAKKGLAHVLRQLLDRGADTTVKDQCCGRSALYWAILAGHETVVELLLEHESPEGLTDNVITLTRLYHAIHADDDNNVQELLSDKQMLQSKNIREFLSLHAAAKHGHESVVETFLENGAEIDSKNEYSQTALMMTAWKGHISVIKLLLENGADINSKDKYSRTALSKAAQRGHISVVKLLLENGAESNSKDKYGQTALSKAAGRGHTPVVELLLENEADIKSSGGYWPSGTTALVEAAGGSHVETVRCLLQAGVNVNARDVTSNMETPLHRAVSKYGKTAVVNILIESGADLEAQNSKGETALVIAVRRGRMDISQLLLERGADPNAVEATVSPSSERIHGLHFQIALELVQEAQRTWKGKETGSVRLRGIT